MMVVVFSNNFNMSQEVDREITICSKKHKSILAYRLEDIEFTGTKEYFLSDMNWIDAFPNPEKNFGRLYDEIKKLLSIDAGELDLIDKGVNTSKGAQSTPNTKKTALISIGVVLVALIIALLYFFFIKGDNNVTEPQPSEVVDKPLIESSVNSTVSVKEVPVEQSKPQETSNQVSRETTTPAQPKTTTMAARRGSSASATDGGDAEILYAKGEAAYNSARYSEAISLYKSAAAANSYKACVKLADIYTTGVGDVSANAMQARKWRDKADKLNK